MKKRMPKINCILNIEYCNFPTKWFESIIWSDESRFCLNRDDFWCSLRASVERLLWEYLKMLKPVHSGIMVSGAFSPSRITELIRWGKYIYDKEFIHYVQKVLTTDKLFSSVNQAYIIFHVITLFNWQIWFSQNSLKWCYDLYKVQI